MAKLNQIIAQRYRQQNIQVAWLFHGHNMPDNSLIEYAIKIEANDLVLASGISFVESLQPLYPRPDAILEMLPNIERLVMGGFHQTDCVERIAKYAHYAGIPTIVDEDTTDRFFRSYALGEQIPNNRSPRQWSRQHSEWLQSTVAFSTILPWEIKRRYKSPWLLPIVETQ